jgi:hypothetical protein
LLAVGSIALHELRYVAPGAHAHEAAVLAAHTYLPLAVALAGLVFVASLVNFAAALRSAGRPERESVRFSFAWIVSALALVLVFVVQESLEGALLGGHTAGLHGLFGHGGWTVTLLAPLLGAVIAFLVKGSERVIELVARKRAKSLRRKPARSQAMRPPLVAAPRVSLLARHLAGRAPPPLAS